MCFPVFVCSKDVQSAQSCLCTVGGCIASALVEWCGAYLQVKKGPLAETSPMLNDISGVAGWAKVRPMLLLHCRAPHTKCTPHAS